MRVHTALHVMCSQVIGGVTGGQIGDGKGRLDLDLAPENVPDKDALNERLNAIVAADHPVTISWITDADLDANPDLVRPMRSEQHRVGKQCVSPFRSRVSQDQ